MAQATPRPSEQMTTGQLAGRPTPEELKEWLRPIEDPELRMSLTDLGLIYEVQLGEVQGTAADAAPANAAVAPALLAKSADAAGKVRADAKMTLTTPACPAAGYIVQQVKNRLLEHPAVAEADVQLVWTPKWDPKTMASEEAKEVLGIW